MVRFSGACHKRFRTLAQAEAFIEGRMEMDASIKAKIKEGLLDGTPAGCSLKTEGGGADDDELTDGLSKMRI